MTMETRVRWRGCRPWMLALVALSAGTGLGAQTQPTYPGAEWEHVASPESVGYSSAGLDAVREHAESLFTTGLMVVVGGKVLFDYGDLEVLSYLASVRKSILAMLYGNYVADGTVNLELTLEDLGMDDVGGLLAVERQATVHDLITARSGVYHPASNSGDNSADAPPRGSQEPGTYLLYNNWDFNAAGAAFERMTGRNIYDALESDLAEPLGMQDFERSAQRKSGNTQRSQYRAYHMWLSTRDMARIGYLMLREGRWEDRQVIPRDWARRISSLVTPLDEMNPSRMRRGAFGYGYMWWVWDGPQETGPYEGAYTGRGAVGQYITVLPALDMIVAHKTATGQDGSTSWGQFQGILDRLLDARCEGECGPGVD